MKGSHDGYSNKMTIQEFGDYIKFQNQKLIQQKASEYRLILDEQYLKSLPETEACSYESNIIKEEDGVYSISVYDAFIKNAHSDEKKCIAVEINDKSLDESKSIFLRTPHTAKQQTLKRPFLSSGSNKKKVLNPFRGHLFSKRLTFSENINESIFSDKKQC